MRSALVCFLSVRGCFHPYHVRVLSCSALSSGTSIYHVVFILSSLPRKRSVSNGVFYFNSIFVWLLGFFIAEVFSEAGGVSSWFLMHQLLCAEVKAGGFRVCSLYLGWMGVNFLLSFAVDSTALCLPSRTSAFCLGKLQLLMQKEFPKDGPWAHAACKVIPSSSQKDFLNKILSCR